MFRLTSLAFAEIVLPMSETLQEYKHRIASSGGKARWVGATTHQKRLHALRMRTGIRTGPIPSVARRDEHWFLDILDDGGMSSTEYPTQDAAKTAMTEWRVQHNYPEGV